MKELAKTRKNIFVYLYIRKSTRYLHGEGVRVGKKLGHRLRG